MSGFILDIGSIVVFFGACFFFKKKPVCMLAPPKQMSFSTIPNHSILFKTLGIRLGAITTPSRGLEQALHVSLCHVYCCFLMLDMLVVLLYMYSAIVVL